MFPARAGMNQLICFTRSFNSHVPRTRGDEPHVDNKDWVIPTCSPHARG